MNSTVAPTMVTDSNYSPAINVVTWFLTLVTVLAVLVRMGTKLTISREVHLDDGAILVAAVCLHPTVSTNSRQLTPQF